MKLNEDLFGSGTHNIFMNLKVGLPRFELKSIAPEATRMPSYPTGPDLQDKNKKCIKYVFGKKT